MNDDSTEKRMAGDYEIIQAVQIGDREVVLGENPQDETGMKYMCAFCRQNALFAEYSEVMASDDFPEIVELFGQRVAEQAQKTHIELNKPRIISAFMRAFLMISPSISCSFCTFSSPLLLFYGFMPDL